MYTTGLDQVYTLQYEKGSADLCNYIHGVLTILFLPCFGTLFTNNNSEDCHSLLKTCCYLVPQLFMSMRKLMNTMPVCLTFLMKSDQSFYWSTGVFMQCILTLWFVDFHMDISYSHQVFRQWHYHRNHPNTSHSESQQCCEHNSVNKQVKQVFSRTMFQFPTSVPVFQYQLLLHWINKVIGNTSTNIQQKGI